MPPDRFVFTGAVPEEDLATFYRTARVYISLSEHEGFCVPLLEAMAADVPVLAYGSTAVPDTLGGAGVCFTPKDLELAAELLGELAYNDDLRAQVIAGQRRRLEDFGDARLRGDLMHLLSRKLNGAFSAAEHCHRSHEVDSYRPLDANCFHRSALRRRDSRRVRSITAG